MRSLLVLVTVVLLGIAPLSGRSVSAQGGQEWVDEAWTNVARPTAGAPLENLDGLEEKLIDFGAEQAAADVQSILARLEQDESQTGYVVPFLETFTHIPEIPEAELMAVYVRSGEFVLDNMGPEPFIVVPGGDGTVNVMNYTGDEQTEHYTLDENAPAYLQNEDGTSCTTVCVVAPPAGAPKIVVQLLEEDWVILPGKELCVWCLLNSYANAGQTTGVLYVYPLLPEGATMDEFSWIERWDAAKALEVQGAPSAEITAPDLADSVPGEPMSNVRAWALFNPAPNCRNG